MYALTDLHWYLLRPVLARWDVCGTAFADTFFFPCDSHAALRSEKPRICVWCSARCVHDSQRNGTTLPQHCSCHVSSDNIMLVTRFSNRRSSVVARVTFSACTACTAHQLCTHVIATYYTTVTAHKTKINSFASFWRMLFRVFNVRG